ncbi:MAG TPA: uracil-DNA glycosylase, partial [Sorangium sp.]|nr:uracil-DNA glycosylase [Sorangium sp.]
EAAFRERVWMAAVLRCFPGKAKSGGDRVPRRPEIAHCRPWMAAEVALLQPQLVIAVGRLAITQVLEERRTPLTQLVGKLRRVTFLGREVDSIALPHPSGVSSWHKTEPGKTLLVAALNTIEQHPCWREAFPTKAAVGRARLGVGKHF